MDVVSLPGGRNVAVRSIRPDDGVRLQAAHARLSPESQYRRFLASKPYLTASDLRYLVEVDGRNHVALVATTATPPHDIIAVGRFVRLVDEPGAAEFAIVVGDRYQGEGLATELLERLALEARARGILRFRAMMLAENEAAHRLMRRLAVRQTHRCQIGQVDEMEFELAA
jgi:RimJ/RimL family protein N-acetyltransferase